VLDASSALVGSWLPSHLRAPEPNGAAPSPSVDARALQPATRPAGTTITGPEDREARARAHSALLDDRLAIGFLGLAVLTNVAIVIYVLTQYHSLPSSIALHWNVNGYPDVIGSPREIWTVPIITALVTIANFLLAWLSAGYDRFVSRFLLGGSVLVQIVAWVGLLTLIK
jgi:hypothetical protein